MEDGSYRQYDAAGRQVFPDRAPSSASSTVTTSRATSSGAPSSATTPRPGGRAATTHASAGVAAARKVLDSAPRSSWRHATVAESAVSSEVVDVLVDGDADTTQALNRAGQVMLAGQRVLVAYPADGGGYIIGTAGGLPLAKPRVVGLTGASTPMADNSLTTIPIPTVVGDTDVMVSFGSAVIMRVSGVFDLDVTLQFDAVAGPAGHRYVEFVRNGTDRKEGPQLAPSGAATVTRLAYRTTERFDAGDVLEVQARHSQGAIINGQVSRFVGMFDGV